MTFFSRRLRCKTPDAAVPGKSFQVERCVNCNREVIYTFLGTWMHCAEQIPPKKGLEYRRASTFAGDTVHVRRDDYPNRAICGQSGLVHEARPYDHVTCRRCRRRL